MKSPQNRKSKSGQVSRKIRKEVNARERRGNDDLNEKSIIGEMKKQLEGDLPIFPKFLESFSDTSEEESVVETGVDLNRCREVNTEEVELMQVASDNKSYEILKDYILEQTGISEFELYDGVIGITERYGNFNFFYVNPQKQELLEIPEQLIDEIESSELGYVMLDMNSTFEVVKKTDESSKTLPEDRESGSYMFR